MKVVSSGSCAYCCAAASATAHHSVSAWCSRTRGRFCSQAAASLRRSAACCSHRTPCRRAPHFLSKCWLPSTSTPTHFTVWPASWAANSRSTAPRRPLKTLLSVATMPPAATCCTSGQACCSKLEADSCSPSSGWYLQCAQLSCLLAPSAVSTTRHRRQRRKNSSWRRLQLASCWWRRPPFHSASNSSAAVSLKGSIGAPACRERTASQPRA